MVVVLRGRAMNKKFDKSSIILNDLTPAQFREVQNYMKDPDYQVDLSVWE